MPQIAVLVPNDDVDQFLTKGITGTAAETLLPQYLAKCSDSKARDAAMRMVRHLARFAWELDDSWGRYSQIAYNPTLDIDIALQFVETILRHREYKLFCKALGWFKTGAGSQLFTLVKEAANGDSFDFSQVKDRWVFIGYETNLFLTLST